MGAEQVSFSIVIRDLGSGPLKKFATNATSSIGKVQKVMGGLQKTVNTTGKTVGSLSKTLDRLGNKKELGLNRELKQANGQMDRLINKANRFSRALNGSSAKGAGVTGGRAGSGAPGGFGIGLGAAAGFLAPMAAIAGMKSMISTGADLQSSLVDIRAILSTSDKNFSGGAFESMTAKMKKLGAETIFTSKDILGATKFMAMAGMNIQQIEQSMPAVTNIAAIANMSLDRAADIATNIQTGYGIAANNMGNVADVMARTMTSANVSMEELGESFKYVGNEAARSGLDFKELSAAIGVLGNNGIKGSMAGTNLRQMLLRMKAPTSAAKKVMDQYNLSFMETVNGVTKMKSISSVIKDVNGKNLSPAELKDLFGVYGGSAFGALSTSLDENGGLMLDNVTEKNSNAAGTASQMAAVKMKTFKGAIAKLQAQFELFSDNLFIRVEPILTKVLGVLETLFKKINTEGSWALSAMATGFNIVGNVMAITYRVIKENAEALKWVAGAALVAFGAFKMFTIIVSITKMVKGLTLAWNALRLVLINNPIGWVVTAIVALGAAVIWAWQRFEGFRGTIFGIWEVMTDFASSMGSMFDNPLESIKSVFRTIASFFTKQMQPVFTLIEAIKKGDWTKALKAGGQLIANMNPAGMLISAGKEIANSQSFKNGYDKAKNGGGTIDFSALTKGFSLPGMSDIGGFGTTGDVSSSILPKMGGGYSDDDEDGDGGSSGKGSNSVSNYRGSGSGGSGGLVINVDTLFSIKTEHLLNSLGNDGMAIRDEMVKQFMAVIKDVEVSYGS
jgi:TP901 family phage tail tape measure protein